MVTPEVISAQEEDISTLSEIAFASKQYWGYPDEWMELWKPDLTITNEIINNDECFKLMLDNEIVGFTIISADNDIFEIEHCWISPQQIGKGLGSHLLKHVLSLPAYSNKPFQVIADPNAVPFYQKFGFVETHQIPSTPEGRSLPFMKMTNQESWY